MEHTFKFSEKETFVLRPSLYALKAIERATGTGIFNVLNACAAGTMAMEQVAIVIESGYRAELHFNNQSVALCPPRAKIEEVVFADGVLNVIGTVIVPFLMALTNGGRDADEPRGSDGDAEKK